MQNTERDIDSRLRVVEDKFAIMEHTTRYNEAWDDGHLDDWVSTWTSDGVFELPGAPDTVGAAALHAMVTAMQEVGFVHVAVNQRISIDGDTARQECYAILGRRSPTRRPGTSSWVTTGRYRDDLVRTRHGWLFARRLFAPDASMGQLPKWW